MWINCYANCSDSLVEEAAGGKTAAISYIERDEEGFLASEVTIRDVKFCLLVVSFRLNKPFKSNCRLRY